MINSEIYLSLYGFNFVSIQDLGKKLNIILNKCIFCKHTLKKKIENEWISQNKCSEYFAYLCKYKNES